jgi:hypothetical protein
MTQTEHVRDIDEVAALHALRVKGAGTVQDVVRVSGVRAAARVVDLLDTLVADGLATRREAGSETYFALTPAGFDADAHASRERLGAQADALAAIYDGRFLDVNARFKALCARWQEQGERIELIEQAAAIHEEVAELLRAAAVHDPPLGRYLGRLGESMEEFLDGESSALLAPVGVSYHNTWFELHEDLIVTLGRSRAEESA